MKKRIGCIAFSPAGANNILAMYPFLTREYDVKVYTFHPYAQSLFQNDILYTYDNLSHILETETLDLVLTGTGSSDNPIERDTPLLCEKQKISCISILDCYWMDDSNLQARFVHLPTYITAPNVDIQTRLSNLLSIPKERILPIGIPHFDNLHHAAKNMNEKVERGMVSFFSTCTTNEAFSDTHPKAKDALIELAEWVQTQEDIQQVMVTKHPREDATWLFDFCSKQNKLTFSTRPSSELFSKSEAVFGLPSTLLYEVSIMGKPHCMYRESGDFIKFPFSAPSNEPSPLASFDACGYLKLFIQGLLTNQN